MIVLHEKNNLLYQLGNLMIDGTNYGTFETGVDDVGMIMVFPAGFGGHWIGHDSATESALKHHSQDVDPPLDIPVGDVTSQGVGMKITRHYGAALSLGKPYVVDGYRNDIGGGIDIPLQVSYAQTIGAMIAGSVSSMAIMTLSCG